jgi:CelD/BcsL family acetyltransferase involved in cellulose biosynthesis
MSSLHTRIIQGLDGLSAHADQWNALWQRSETLQPMVTAELIDLWCKSFAQETTFLAIVVESAGEFIAALPLLTRRQLGVFSSLEFPTNCWSNAGDLLLDASCDRSRACHALLAGLGQLDHQFVVFDEINIESARWLSFLSALEDKNREYGISKSYTVGITNILHDWQRYQASWSSNHRRALKKSMRRIEAKGEVKAERISEHTDELAPILRQCFEIEDRGWKGETGGSVLKTPGMLDFMIQEATLVAKKGMLDLWLLKFDNRIIAFNYCHYAKGTCLAHKISFDPEFSDFGPGRLLRLFQLEEMHNDPQALVFDSFGMMCQANASWSTATYTMGKLMAATGSAYSGQLLKAMKLAQPLFKRLKSDHVTLAEAPQVGASRYLETVAEPQRR